MEAPLAAAPRKNLLLQGCPFDCHSSQVNLQSRPCVPAINLTQEDSGLQTECFPAGVGLRFSWSAICPSG